MHVSPASTRYNVNCSLGCAFILSIPDFKGLNHSMAWQEKHNLSHLCRGYMNVNHLRWVRKCLIPRAFSGKLTCSCRSHRARLLVVHFRPIRCVGEYAGHKIRTGGRRDGYVRILRSTTAALRRISSRSNGEIDKPHAINEILLDQNSIQFCMIKPIRTWDTTSDTKEYSILTLLNEFHQWRYY
jgi:hypothetical protein